MVDAETRPFLRSEYSTTITNAHQLQLMAMDLNASYTLANDIDLAEVRRASGMWKTATGFAPIGQTGFGGSLDGKNHLVSGLYVNFPNNDVIGLFGGIARTGFVANLSLMGTGCSIQPGGYYSTPTGDVIGRSNVGALAGYNFGTVANVALLAVDGFDFRTDGVQGVGGLIGYNTGSVTASNGRE